MKLKRGDTAPGPTVLVAMGICGCGKSTVASRLAQDLGISMLDADAFHPPTNIAKMEAGQPLTDEDRAGWLQAINKELRRLVAEGESVALACSALKQRYRDALAEGLPRIEWIYLKGSRELILSRMERRRDHFMPVSLVDSQLAALEEPSEAVEVDIEQSPEVIARQLSERFADLRRS